MTVFKDSIKVMNLKGEFGMNVAIIGYGSRGEIYGNSFISRAKISAVCDIKKERLGYARKIFGLEESQLYSSSDEFFAKGKLADLCVIATPDKVHKNHAIEAMRAGYDLLLEKPIGCTEQECQEIYKTAKQLNRRVFICHVLRYAAFYSKIKEELDTGKYGEISTISATENVAYWHYAHSYVRGNWHRAEDSTPMIVAKCCHDLDIISWYIGKPCTGVSSMGCLRYFTAQNAPKDCAERCVDCTFSKQCPYSAETFYLEKIRAGQKEWPSNVLATEPTEEKIKDAIANGPYGKCVYRCDNDVVDHQVVNMEFEGGATASLTMTAFSGEQFREIHIHGEKGDIYGTTKDNKLVCNVYGNSSKVIDVLKDHDNSFGHGGGDYWLVQDVLNTYEGKPSIGLTSIENSMMSHKIGFAAEESRLKNGELIKLN